MNDLPYELLRRAKSILEDTQGGIDQLAADWLKDFENLPGAELSNQHVRVLQNPALRCAHNKHFVQDLLDDGYMMKVHHVRGPGRTSVQIRLNKKGQDALRLRSEFKEEIE